MRIAVPEIIILMLLATFALAWIVIRESVIITRQIKISLTWDDLVRLEKE